jgi:transcriptional regulator with XRE-family HTH domain
MATDLGQRVGRRIKEHRELRGLTQLQLAELIGRGVETISNFERGKTIPALVTLDLVARCLRVPLADLFRDSQPVGSSQGRRSRHALKVSNAADYLSEDDLEIVAGIIRVLERRRRRPRQVARTSSKR